MQAVDLPTAYSINLFTGLVWVNWEIQMRSLYSPQKNWTSFIQSFMSLANSMLWFIQNGNDDDDDADDDDVFWMTLKKNCFFFINNNLKNHQSMRKCKVTFCYIIFFPSVSNMLKISKCPTCYSIELFYPLIEENTINLYVWCQQSVSRKNS